VADGGVGPGEDEVVGHGGAVERDVGFGLACPFVGEADAVAADDGEGRDLAMSKPLAQMMTSRG
jgi:hypothetical protein